MLADFPQIQFKNIPVHGIKDMQNGPAVLHGKSKSGPSILQPICAAKKTVCAICVKILLIFPIQRLDGKGCGNYQSCDLR